MWFITHSTDIIATRSIKIFPIGGNISLLPFPISSICQCRKLLLNRFESFVVRHCCQHLICGIRMKRINFDPSVALFIDDFFFISQQFASEHQKRQDVQYIRIAGLRDGLLKKALQRFTGNLPLRSIVGNVFCGRFPPAEKFLWWSRPVFGGNIFSGELTVFSR